eukprot:GSChrysophyteH2.ASY1.ANO1.758.1 assembled CDS
MQVVQQAVLHSLLPVLSPVAVASIAQNSRIPPPTFQDGYMPNGVILTGAVGCGTTTLCNHLCWALRRNPSILASTHRIDCLSLAQQYSAQPLKTLLAEVERRITCVIRMAPAVLVLDRLDALAPTTLSSADKGGSAGSGNLSPRLVNSTYFAAPVSLPRSPHPKARMSIVRDALAALGCQCIASASATIATATAAATVSTTSSSSTERNEESRLLLQFRDCTAGMCAADLVALASQIIALVAPGSSAWEASSCSSASSSGTTRGPTTLQCSLQDILSAEAPQWAAIGGLQSAKKQILSLFRSPVMYRRLFQQMGARSAKAMLLYGPPGCGKTMLAKATAAKCGLRSVCVAGPQLLNKYIGASEKAVRSLFEDARDCGRSTLIFLDEFEALVPKRGKDNTGVTDRVVNQFLTFLDGVEDTMAATSRPDMIDPAILRPGRVETHVYLGLPSVKDREKILRVALAPLYTSQPDGGMTIDEAILDIVSHRKSDDFNSSDLHAVVSTAFLLATHDHMRVQGEGESKAEADSHRRVALHGRHLWQAFEQTRPSLSPEDRLFYDGVHGVFRKGANAEKKEGAERSGDSGGNTTKEIEAQFLQPPAPRAALAPTPAPAPVPAPVPMSSPSAPSTSGYSLLSSPERTLTGATIGADQAGSPVRADIQVQAQMQAPSQGQEQGQEQGKEQRQGQGQWSPPRPYVPNFSGLRGSPFLVGLPARARAGAEAQRVRESGEKQKKQAPQLSVQAMSELERLWADAVQGVGGTKEGSVQASVSANATRATATSASASRSTNTSVGREGDAGDSFFALSPASHSTPSKQKQRSTFM